MRSGPTRPDGSSWSESASPLQGKGSVLALPSGAVPPLGETQKRESSEVR